jgi:hypothetical protein
LVKRNLYQSYAFSQKQLLRGIQEFKKIVLERTISGFQKEAFESMPDQGVKLLFRRGQRFARIMCQHEIIRLRRLETETMAVL